MITQRGRFLISHNKEDDVFIEEFDFEMLENKYQEVKKFFDFAGDLEKVRINFIYHPEEFEFFTGIKFEKWISAICGHNTTIHIISPSVMELLTTHKTDSFLPTLVHEISHLIYGYSKLPNLQLWNEGIAEHLSREKCRNKINFDLPSLKAGDPRYNYGVGHLLIDSIMDKFPECGPEKIIKFLKNTSIDDAEKNLLDKFFDSFKVNPNTLLQLQGGEY